MAEPPRSEFARQLHELREGKLLTHAKLADAAGIHFRTISDLERDLYAPRKSTVTRLADALGLAGEDRASFEAAARDRGKIGKRAAAGTGAAAESRTREAAARRTATRTLPRDIASFTGRESELRQLVDAAKAANEQVGVYVIEGMAGVGKSSLAIRAAHRIAHRFPDGQLFLDLHGYTFGVRPLSPEGALRSLLRLLGIPQQVIPKGLEDCAALYRSCLAGTRTLIILDNAASTAQVKPLLPGTAGCVVIITSRRDLRGLDGAQSLHLDTPPPEEAITLFRTVAGPERFREDDPDLAEIVALCECLPIAVQIIAARVSRRKGLPLSDVLDELRRERSRLSYLQDEDRNVTAVFGLSLRHLPDPRQQQMFQRLGLIPGPDFDVGAVASLTETDYGTARRHLESLLDHNLLLQHASGRYRFHDLVRAFARTLTPSIQGRRSQVPGGGPPDRDDVSGTAAEVLGRLLNFYLYAAQAADRCFERRIPRAGKSAAVTRPNVVPRLDTAERAQAWISAELANLDAAAHYAFGHHPAMGVALSAALAQYLGAHGPWPLALTLHQGALDAARTIGDLPSQAESLGYLGHIQRRSGALAEAEKYLAQALDIYRELNDPHGQAGILVELGIVQRLTGVPEQAADGLAHALTLYRAQDSLHGQAGALTELGGAQRQEGRFTSAEECLSEALDLYRRLGNRAGEAATLCYLGSVQVTTGTFGPAEESLTGAFDLNRDLDDPIGQANNLLLLGVLHRATGAFARAEDSLSSAMDIYSRLGDRRGQAGALVFLGTLYTLAGKYKQSSQCLSQGLELFQELHDRGGEAETLIHYAALATETGAPRKARARYTQALRLAREIRSPKDEADALEGIATTYRLERDIDRVKPYLQQALELYLSLECSADAARVRATLTSIENN